MEEVWMKIKGFPFYEVSNFGNIRSTRFNKVKILKQQTDKDGYKQLNLYLNKKMYKVKVHRIVASTFISNKDNKKLVNHINGIKSDNRVVNLEWTTDSENMVHSMYCLGNCVKPVICIETGMVYPSIHIACKDTGVNVGNLSMALKPKYKRKTCGGYHWRFYEKIN